MQTADMTLRIRARAARGPSGLVDYQITVPRWMPVNLSGTYLEATIEGTAAEVTVETVHGNVRVVGGAGTVSLRSVEGMITVDKASRTRAGDDRQRRHPAHRTSPATSPPRRPTATSSSRTRRPRASKSRR